MANHAHLLGDDVQLLASLNADLPQGTAVMRTDAFGFRQFVAHDVTRQISIKWFASTLDALVGWRIHRGVAAILTADAILQRWRGLRCCGQSLGLVEEHVLLLGAARFALGGEELTQHLVEPLLEQVTLSAHKAQF